MKTKIFYTVIFITISLTTFAQRKVLVEQFTNSGCPPCAANTPLVATYVNSNPNDVLMLAYHTAFPYSDSMYYENSFQSNQRVSFYSVGAVPTSIVDGNFFTGNLVPTLNSTIPNAGIVTARYNINFITSNLNGNTVNVSVMFESADAANNGESLTAMIVLTEKNVLKSSYVCCAGANIETEYPWVVRRMLPDENGTTLLNTNFNGTDLVNLTWNTTNIKNLNELRIIAFVQNTVTKAIYQSEISTATLATAVLENSTRNENLFLVNNPVSNQISIHFNQPSEKYTLKIVDVLGKTIYHQEIKNCSDKIIDATNFKSGIYFISVNDSFNSEMKKIILSK